jgi:hypothetical protein
MQPHRPPNGRDELVVDRFPLVKGGAKELSSKGSSKEARKKETTEEATPLRVPVPSLSPREDDRLIDTFS